MDKAEALIIVKDEFSRIKGFEITKCQEEPTRTKYYVCYGIKEGKDAAVQNIDEALKKRFDLLSDWKFEYSASATYIDNQENIYVGIVYTKSSKALGNEDLAKGYQGVVDVFVEDNPYK